METLQNLLLTPYGSLMAILAVLVVGELVAKLTKGVVPMALTVTVLLLALFWTHVFPAEIVPPPASAPRCSPWSRLCWSPTWGP